MKNKIGKVLNFTIKVFTRKSPEFHNKIIKIPHFKKMDPVPGLKAGLVPSLGSGPGLEHKFVIKKEIWS